MPEPELIRRVAETSGISSREAARVIEDVLAFYREPIEDYVRRRHAHLQAYGMRNEQIFEQLAAEISTRPFAAPTLSTRQLRRIVYG